MTLKIDRRALIATAGFGIGGLVMPGGSLVAQTLLGLTGFTHNVASGEPGPNSVLLWTRYVSKTGGQSKVRVEVSDTPNFAKIVTGGEMITGPWRDHTVKITVDGLQPGRFYWFRFIAPDGTKSPTGRTKTLPVGKAAQFNIAIFSCSNLGFGEFNAYGHAAARNDIDLVLHMGDYIYEYGRGGYDNGTQFSEKLFPAGECLTLADYRLRYASYRTDPQLQALHANFPWIPSTDDHESANDSWEGGAQNHTADEGDWSARRNATSQVWREWLPVGDLPWKRYDFGDLGSYFRTDTRVVGRTKPYWAGDLMRAPDSAKAFADFRDGAWRDPASTMFGTEQESWLFQNFARSKGTWTVLGSGTNMGYNYTPEEAMNWFGPNTPDFRKNYSRQGIAAAKAGLPYNFDNWGGYPVARSRVFAHAQKNDLNLVVVSGDSHNGWAFDLPEDGRPAGVEFGGHSVSSPGIESATAGTDPNRIARDILARNTQELRWVDTSNRGYMHLSLTPKAATNNWVFMDTVRTLSLKTKPGHSLRVRPGRKVLEQA
ncbi:MAG: alkaline phosphatase D family protein [Sphingomonadaceae bacterium]|jgi:alkaline phosphatase D